jgi:hypothetical protein
MNRRKVGSSNLWGWLTPWWGPSPCALSWWLSGGSLWWFQVSTWFWGSLGTLVGHRIHVMHTWRLLIRRVFLPWIDDVMDPRDACMAAPHWLSLELLGSKRCVFFSFLVLNTCIRLCISTCGICQFKLLLYCGRIVPMIKCRNWRP